MRNITRGADRLFSFLLAALMYCVVTPICAVVIWPWLEYDRLRQGYNVWWAWRPVQIYDTDLERVRWVWLVPVQRWLNEHRETTAYYNYENDKDEH